MKSLREMPPANLRELLEDCAVRFGTKTAFRDKQDGVYQGVSFARVHTEAKALALMLKKRYAPGTRVLILGKNSYRWALSFLALTLLGVVPVPVDPALRAKDLVAIATAAEAKGVLYAPEARSKRRTLVGVTAVSFDKYPFLIAEGKRRVASGEYGEEAPLSPKGLAALFFTPGTTGTPKGVMLSHQNLIATLCQMQEMMKIDEEDVFLSVLPLSHTYECVCGLLAPFYCGATVAFGEGLSHFLRNMREIHPTCMVTIPYLAKALYEKCWRQIRGQGREARVRRLIAVSDPVRPLSVRQAMKERLLADERALFGGSLRRLLILGGAVDAAVQKGLRQLGVFAVQGYGVTECAGLAAMNRDDLYRDGTAGVALPDSILEICNPQPDGSGEIRYRGKNVMLGYLNDPERTENVLIHGWYYTGDMGRIDKDGFLHVLGRKQNCICTVGGHWICPEELERLLRQSPFIKDAVVVGYPHPETGESEAAALILPDYNYAAEAFATDEGEADLSGTVTEWVATLNGDLAPYQQIGRTVLCTKPFPRDAAGRVRRTAVAREFAAMQAQAEST